MNKIFFLSLLSLLVAAHGVAGSMTCDNNMGMLQELESLDIEEENEVELSDIPSWRSERGGKVLVNVDSFGAAGNGESDDTEAFQKAWNISCSTPKSVFLVPQGRIYLVNATKFIGPCAGNIIIQPCKGAPTALTIDSSSAIKGGSGYVRGVRFQNVRVENVSNPIIIDQFYCDSPSSCQNQTSGVEISEIMYQNISGTTKSDKAIKFDCSDAVPCNNLVLSNVNLEKLDGTVQTYCHSAQGFGYGVVHPSAECLNSNDKISQLHESIQDDIIHHTEL
ncbi:hypothetical protein TanjilG_16577 [Lupinus angustifolius]|uniref:Pectate lyase superfamily protein domain-containing protein n=1 Tax=Lupinus angustifolius TaxID=3871 RepID=A0A1J7G0C4_LUPAN|nr:hypothetical protein TanjilG_16577 [Lupinus angustifolius]